MADKKSVKLVVTFAERGKGKALAKLYAEQGVLCNYQSMGRGTASSDLLDVLGIGSAEKDILISITSGERSQRLLRRLDDGLESDIYGSGIVFDMPLTGLNSLIATVLLSGQESGNGGTQMEAKTDYSLILVSVNQGHTDDVMDTARQAGARGGTVIRARWAGPEDTSQFYGISLQSEKEIIAIVAAGDLRNAIMEMINKKHGLKTEAAAMVCSVGLEHYVKFS
ncbi:hypothetical protein [Candidatus Acetatifactor stercoripullorum]|uniref:hypothetical protein n=1 Tax=Candidatus Acetatifactor stercoripullorum TaxID=2838414 RepID=UPI00298D7528|nr:hypothetical protein [Candidatus Acetatifactor stercoripullorum]